MQASAEPMLSRPVGTVGPPFPTLPRAVSMTARQRMPTALMAGMAISSSRWLRWSESSAAGRGNWGAPEEWKAGRAAPACRTAGLLHRRQPAATAAIINVDTILGPPWGTSGSPIEIPQTHTSGCSGKACRSVPGRRPKHLTLQAPMLDRSDQYARFAVVNMRVDFCKFDTQAQQLQP